MRAGEPVGDQLGLPPADCGEWCLRLALESTLGDERRFAVAYQDERRIQTGRD
jgi:hypothetical protein